MAQTASILRYSVLVALPRDSEHLAGYYRHHGKRARRSLEPAIGRLRLRVNGTSPFAFFNSLFQCTRVGIAAFSRAWLCVLVTRAITRALSSRHPRWLETSFSSPSWVGSTDRFLCIITAHFHWLGTSSAYVLGRKWFMRPVPEGSTAVRIPTERRGTWPYMKSSAFGSAVDFAPPRAPLGSACSPIFATSSVLLCSFPATRPHVPRLDGYVPCTE